MNPFARGEICPDPFRTAYNMGLEELVSRRRDRGHPLRKLDPKAMDKPLAS